MGVARVRVCVREVRGRCDAGLKPGDCFTVDGYRLEGGPVCLHALAAMWHFIYALAKGVPAEEMGIGSGGRGFVQCPDPGPPYTRGGTVVFELVREEAGGRGARPPRPP